MTDILLFTFASAYCAAACYLDLRKRVIPDWLTYAGIAAGLLIGAFVCTYLGAPFAIQYAAMLAVALALGYALFLLGVWAGGDAKLFWAFAALFGAAGRAEPFLPVALFAASALLFLAATFLLNVKAVLKKRKECKKIVFEAVRKSANAAAVAALFAAGIANDVALVAVISAAFLLVRLPKYFWAAVLLVALAVNADAAAVAFPAAFAFAIALGTIVRISADIIAPSLSYRVAARDLEEGMVPKYTVIEKAGKAVLFKPRLGLKKVLAAVGRGEKDAMKILRDAGLLPPVRVRIVADASYSGGLDAKQLQRLKKLENVRWLQVQRTMAFAPFLCACFLAALAGLF